MSDYDDFDDDIDEAIFDAALNAAKKVADSNSTSRSIKPVPVSFRASQPVASTSALPATQVRYKQQTLFGASPVPEKPKRSSQQPSARRMDGTRGQITLQDTQSGFSTQLLPRIKAVKQWDRIQSIQSLTRAISNGRSAKSTSSARKRTNNGVEDEEDEASLSADDSETERLLLAAQNAEETQASIPMKLQCDQEEIKTWVYSINKPKRKYQYDIVAKALFNNCLVSLPTGLGKTFIAAVVMLNFYRWYPQGKILFLAPTKPLVQQQIEACHSIAGIPSCDCLTLTGSVPPAKRAKIWSQKRVVFSTPQTVMNDLAKGILRPEDVICVVVDEAHRATGGYAYCVVIKWLMRFNPHFRVLALTATPGSDPERVQEVIDNLHIGHIEVRTEESMDIKPYTKTKEIVLEVIQLSPELTSIRDKWGLLMKPYIKQCDSLFRGPKEPALIHPFSVTSALTTLPKEKQYMRPSLMLLSKMANAMAKLLEYSIPIGFDKMRELKEEQTKSSRLLCSTAGYKSLMAEVQELTLSPSFSPHPKMDKMKAMIIDFFISANDRGKSTRLMVFCHFRDVVTDIVGFLNQEKPLIKASAFIGQGTDTKGNKGMSQKQQAEVIAKFKADEFNVLVATSIGEEGLDIGALDCIICYEAQKSPLRMLQRLGRTGRNEEGKVIVLMAQGREEHNWDKAKDQYQHVQNALLSKTGLELFDDCERLIPEGTRPIPIDKTLDVQPYIPEEVELEKVASAAGKKDKPGRRKRPGVEDLPPGATSGFMSAFDYQPTKSKASAMVERVQAALLNEVETETLKTKWMRNIKIGDIPRPIDDVKKMKIKYFSTSTAFGRKLESHHCRTSWPTSAPSHKFSKLLNNMMTLAIDDEIYESWKNSMNSHFNDKHVVWWEDDRHGQGAPRPLRLCDGTRQSFRRSWTKFMPILRNNNPLSRITESPDIELVGPSLSSGKDEVASRALRTTSRPANIATSRKSTGQAHLISDDELPDLDELLANSGPSKSLTATKKSGSKRSRGSSPHSVSEPLEAPDVLSSPLHASDLSPHAKLSLSGIYPSLSSYHQPPSSFDSAINADAILRYSPGADYEYKALSPAYDVHGRNDTAFEADGLDDTAFRAPYRSPDHGLENDKVMGSFMTTNKSHSKSPVAENPQSNHRSPMACMGPDAATPFVSRMSEDAFEMSDLDPLALAQLDEIENNYQAQKMPLESTKHVNPPKTPVAAPVYKAPRRSMASDLNDEASPLIFRSKRMGHGHQPSPSEFENGDHFIAPPMIGTQMPRAKRQRIRDSDASEAQAARKSKLIIAEDSEPEEAQGSTSQHPSKTIQRTRFASNEAVAKVKPNKGKGKAIIDDRPSNKRSEGREKPGSKKRDQEWAYKNALFDLEASESEHSGDSDARGKKRKRRAPRSSSPSIASEDSSDRAFVVETSSSRDEMGEQSMTGFYRASIMSQNPLTAGKFAQEANVYNGRYKWADSRQAGGSNRRRVVQDTPNRNDNDESREDWSYDSFCVPDEATLEYEEEGNEDLTSEL